MKENFPRLREVNFPVTALESTERIFITHMDRGDIPWPGVEKSRVLEMVGDFEAGLMDYEMEDDCVEIRVHDFVRTLTSTGHKCKVFVTSKTTSDLSHGCTWTRVGMVSS